MRFQTAAVVSLCLGCAGSGQGELTDVDAALASKPDYRTLEETGLYEDLSAKTIASGIDSYRPNFELWSDGLEKSRFVYIPKDGKINVSNMDQWTMPVGTKLWKEFADPATGAIETRLIHRWGPEEDDYWLGSFLWDSAGTNATLVESTTQAGAFDVPGQGECAACHDNGTSMALGFSAIQLSHESAGVNFKSLYDDGIFEPMPTNGDGFPLTTGVETEALGYLHANCAHCHQEGSSASGTLATGLHLELLTGLELKEQPAYQTAVSQPLTIWTMPGVALRVAPQDPSGSGLRVRMSEREFPAQMPPAHSGYSSTKQVDSVGLAAIDAWINSLN